MYLEFIEVCYLDFVELIIKNGIVDLGDIDIVMINGVLWYYFMIFYFNVVVFYKKILEVLALLNGVNFNILFDMVVLGRKFWVFIFVVIFFSIFFMILRDLLGDGSYFYIELGMIVCLGLLVVGYVGVDRMDVVMVYLGLDFEVGVVFVGNVIVEVDIV